MMKYTFLWMFIVSLFISTLALAAEKIVYVSVPSVNIRIGAGTQYKVLKSVPIGYPLRILVDQNDWYQVELKDKTVGWVYKTMVTTDIPPAVRIEQLGSRLNSQASEFERTRMQLQVQTNLNADLEKKLEETRQELDKLIRKNKELEKQDHIKLAGIGIGLLILGWIGGFLAGFFKRQAEDKRFVKMMIDANSLKKG